MEVKAKNVTPFAPKNPGEFTLLTRPGTAEISGMEFMCPCGCGRLGWLCFEREVNPSWMWDRNHQSPTLAPSIQQIGGCEWHGWLTVGVFSEYTGQN